MTANTPAAASSRPFALHNAATDHTQVQNDKSKLREDRKSKAGKSVIKQDKETIHTDKKAARAACKSKGSKKANDLPAGN